MAIARCRHCAAVIPDDQHTCPFCGAAAPGSYRRVVLRASALVGLALMGAGLLQLREPAGKRGECRILRVTTRQQMFLTDGVMRNGYSVLVQVERTGPAQYVMVTGTLHSPNGGLTERVRVPFDIWPTEEAELRFYLPEFVRAAKKVDVTCH
ncbi:hypothetical protein [Pseudooceanicola nanhaiensis]|uniref:hypothetical protein n=1 Tax=Pseudooceanicola nanhaiensis TaxID=375761 RepID=UPI001CD5AA5A|nr:hypothetical protein [Pseudooceanicola nanhaiensis]MCA0921035.1 hypothetical protein [Pseudooceanicola nanhaiensis]